MSIKCTRRARLPPREWPVNWNFARSPNSLRWSIISGMNCWYIPFAASQIPLWTIPSVSWTRMITCSAFGASSQTRSLLKRRKKIASPQLHDDLLRSDYSNYEPIQSYSNGLPQIWLDQRKGLPAKMPESLIPAGQHNEMLGDADISVCSTTFALDMTHRNL